jgi:hypothetical protein
LIKKDPFFAEIDFKKIKNNEITPPLPMKPVIVEIKYENIPETTS